MGRILALAFLCAATAALAQAPADPESDVRDPAVLEAAELENLQQRVNELEARVEDQAAELEEAAETLEDVQSRVAQEEALTADETARTIESHRAARLQSGADRASAIEDALVDIEAAQELVEAGSDSVDARISAASTRLDGASLQAGQWGASAEAERLARAAWLVQQVPQLIETRNHAHATMALVAARDWALSALALARTDAPGR